MTNFDSVDLQNVRGKLSIRSRLVQLRDGDRSDGVGFLGTLNGVSSVGL